MKKQDCIRIYSKLAVKYDVLKDSHDDVVMALEVLVDILKGDGTITSSPKIEAVLIKAKKL